MVRYIDKIGFEVGRAVRRNIDSCLPDRGKLSGDMNASQLIFLIFYFIKNTPNHIRLSKVLHRNSSPESNAYNGCWQDKVRAVVAQRGRSD